MGIAQTHISQDTQLHWIALSDHAGPLNTAGITEIVEQGSFVLEFVLPTDVSTVLLNHRATNGWPRTFSIFHDATAGLVVVHRQGATMRRHVLPGPLPATGRLARLTFAWDGPARQWSLQLEDAGGAWLLRADGIDPIPMAAPDILALCAGAQGSRRDAAVQWFGVCLQVPDLAAGAWIGHRTPVETARGNIAAADLKTGDKIITRDNGLCSLRGMACKTYPNRGRFAAVLLRAPYFARQTDVLVSRNQLVLLTGAAVEYLFGEDVVLANASALQDGSSAMPDTRRQLSNGVMLDFGAPQVIFADGCPLLVQTSAITDPLPHRLLHGHEAATLQSLLGRGVARYAAWG